MNGIAALGSEPVARAVAWALVHFLWQGALVGLALGGVLRVLSKASAALRYTVSAGSLLVLLALPIATTLILLPGARESEVPITLTVDSQASERISGPAAPASTVPAPPAVRGFVEPALPGVLGLWIAGVACLSFYNLGGLLQAWRLKRRSTRPVPEDLEMSLIKLRRRLGIERAVTILESAAVSVPAVIGWLRPVILVPASALSGLSPRQLEAVLAHELAHVRRHDYLVNLLQTVIETVLFYHPVVWWISGVVRREREHCCDDLAVVVCGDRLGYARALADLETLRIPSHRLAMAADGGSLLARVKRLAGVPAGAPRRPWMAGVLALSLLPAGMFVEFGRPVAAPAAPEPRPQASNRDEDFRGTWTLRRKDGDEVWLQMTRRSEKGKGTWNNSFSLPARELAGLTAGPEARFELRRDAGTFLFEGRFQGDEGTGFFTFQPNPAFGQELEGMGYSGASGRLLELATFDVSRRFVQEIRDLGYEKASLNKLIAFRIHGVSPEFIREIAGLGLRNLSEDRLIAFRIHGVTPEYLRALSELGYRDLSGDQLVAFRIHGVSPEFLKAVAGEGYENVDPNDLVAMRIHGVNAEFIRDAKKRHGDDLTVDELVEMRILGDRRRPGRD